MAESQRRCADTTGACVCPAGRSGGAGPRGAGHHGRAASRCDAGHSIRSASGSGSARKSLVGSAWPLARFSSHADGAEPERAESDSGHDIDHACCARLERSSADGVLTTVRSRASGQGLVGRTRTLARRAPGSDAERHSTGSEAGSPTARPCSRRKSLVN